MMQNIGKVKIEGKTLTEYLQKTFDSNKYKNLQEGDTNFDGGKEVYIKKYLKVLKIRLIMKCLKHILKLKML